MREPTAQRRTTAKRPKIFPIEANLATAVRQDLGKAKPQWSFGPLGLITQRKASSVTDLMCKLGQRPPRFFSRLPQINPSPALDPPVLAQVDTVLATFMPCLGAVAHYNPAPAGRSGLTEFIEGLIMHSSPLRLYFGTLLASLTLASCATQRRAVLQRTSCAGARLQEEVS